MAFFGLFPTLRPLTIESVTKQVEQVLNGDQNLRYLSTVHSKKPELLRTALEAQSTANLQKLSKLTLYEANVEIEEVLSDLLTIRYRQTELVEQEKQLNAIQSQLIEQQAADLMVFQKHLTQQYYLLKIYFGSAVQRQFVNLIAAEVAYNNFVVEEVTRLRLLNCIRTGASAEQVIVDYSASNPFKDIEACVVTAILYAEFYPDRTPKLDTKSEQYILAFQQAEMIKKMSDYEVIDSLL